MKTSRSLDSYSFKELCALAERLGLKRWTHLRKEGLLQFLQEHVERENKPAKRGRSKASKAEAIETEAESPKIKKTRKTANKAATDETETTAGKKTRKTANKVEKNEAETKAPANRKTRKTANKAEAIEAEPKATASRETKRTANKAEAIEAEPKATASRKTRGTANKAEASAPATKTAGRAAKTASPAEPVAEPPKRRGRPKKAVASEDQPTLFDVKGESEPEAEVVKPRRGRRPKVAEAVPEAVEPVPAKKRRARVVEETPVDVVEPPQKRRGRKSSAEKQTLPAEAAKPVVVEEAVDVEVPPKKTRKRAVKAKPVDEVVEVPTAEPVVEPPKKRRGRKSAAEKQALLVEAVQNAVEEKVEEKAVEVEASPKKRRGRKPKNEQSVEPTPEAPEEAETPVVEEQPAEVQEAPKKRGRRKKAVEEPTTPSWIEEEEEKRSSWDDEDEKKSSWDDDDDDEDEDDEDDLFDEDDEEDSPEIEEPKRKPKPEPAPVAPAEPASEQALALKEKLLSRKIVGSPNDRVDRLVLFVCDSFWLRACWEITPLLVDRVRSAMGRHWYTADPALRVFYVDRDGPGSTGRRELFSEIEIRGGVDNWYVPVDNPPSHFMVELGYRSRDGQFFTLASSNTVQTPQRFVHDSFGRSTIDDLNSRVRWDASASGAGIGYAVKPASAKIGPKPAPSEAFPVATGFNRTDVDDKSVSDEFYVDAEVVVKGHAAPNTSVSIKDEPITLRPDGTFSVRYSLPERRHVFPVVMSSRDGMETQTIVLSVDRNTKKLDPVFKEDDED